MKAVVQRVTEASVTSPAGEVATIGQGLVVLVGVAQGDTSADADWLANKISDLRIFTDEHGRMNESVSDIGGEVLVVSQFTLLADTARGRRPSFVSAAKPEDALPLIDRVCLKLRERGLAVATGFFGEKMNVKLTNDGPVTIILDSPKPD